MATIISAKAVVAFLTYFSVGVLMTAVFTRIYVAVTPYNEFEQIRKYGHVGPAITLGAAMLGFAMPLLSASLHGVNLLDFAVWGILAGLIQLAAFWLFYQVAAKSAWQDIMEGRNLASAILYGTIVLVVGLFNAFSLIP